MLGRPLYRFDRVSSTMDVLAELAAVGAREGTTIVAGFQDAGKGRADRRWVVPAGRALLASVLLRPDVQLHRLMPLSILVADAIREAILSLCGLDASIKWPNDVLIDGRKLSGVLIQTRQNRTGAGNMHRTLERPVVIVGFGINVNVEARDLPLTGTSLLVEGGQVVDQDQLLTTILDALSVRYRELLDERLETRWDDIQTRLAMRGEHIRVEDAGRMVSGVLAGIDPDGALVINDGAQNHRIVAGDLSRGPKPVQDGGSKSGKPGILP